MRTSGGSGETLMLLVPVAVGAAIGMLFYGGPAGLLTALDSLVRDVVHLAVRALDAWF